MIERLINEEGFYLIIGPQGSGKTLLGVALFSNFLKSILKRKFIVIPIYIKLNLKNTILIIF